MNFLRNNDLVLLFAILLICLVLISLAKIMKKNKLKTAPRYFNTNDCLNYDEVLQTDQA